MSKIEKTDDFHLTIAEIKKRLPPVKSLDGSRLRQPGGAWSKNTIHTLMNFPEGRWRCLTMIS